MTTPNFQTQALPFEQQLSGALSKIWDYIDDDTNTNWTKAVKQIMVNEVRTLRPNLKIAACSIETSDGPEWLYDFVCYENNDIGLNDVILVAESEWTGRYTQDYLRDVQDDFEKLILARSPYKLMIFEGHSEIEIKDFIVHLTTVVKHCKLTTNGDRYMFAGWVNAKEFYYDVYIHN